MASPPEKSPAPPPLLEGTATAWYWHLAYPIVALLFALICLNAGAERSLHIDEVATFREGAARVVDSSIQSQHAWFLDSYYWYLSFASSLSLIRLPSILASAFGLWILAVCAQRTFSHTAGIATMVAMLAIPQFWMSAVEARFYGFMFLFGVMSFAGVLLAISRRYLSSAVLVIIPGVIATKFHIGAAPFHVVLAGLAIAIFLGHAISDLYEVRSKKESLPRELRVRLVIASAIALAGLIAIGLGFRWALELLEVLRGRSANRPQDVLEEGWTAVGVLDHILGWAGRGFGGWHEFSSRVVFAVAPVAGVIALAVARRWLLLVVCTLALLVHYAAAFLSSINILFAIKYLSSSLCIFAFLCGALVWLVEKIKPGAPLAILVLAAPFTVAGFIDVQSFFRRDPSNAIRISRQIVRATPDGREPVLLAPLALIEMIRFHASMGFCPEVESIPREEVEGIAETTLLMWDRKFFRAEIDYASIETIAGIPAKNGFVVRGPYYSSFDRDFHYRLYSTEADHVLAGGMEAVVVGSGKILFVESGEWIVDSVSEEILIDKETFPTPHVLKVAQPRLYNISATSRVASINLTPNYANSPQRRSAVFANSGDLYAYNRPVELGGRRFYMLSNNLSLEYTVRVPDDRAWISFGVRNDEPSGGQFAVELDDELVAVLVLPNYDQENRFLELQMEVPRLYAGRTVNLRITNLAENSANKEDSPDTRFLYLENITLSLEPDEGAISPNALTSMEFVPPWQNAFPKGSVDFSLPENREVVGILGGPSHARPALGLLSSGGGLHLPLQVDPGQGGYLLPPIAVDGGSHLFFSLEARTTNLRDSSVATMISFYDRTGKHLSGGQLSRRTFERRSSRWTRRSALLDVPEGASRALVVLYINKGEAAALEVNPELILREMRIVAPRFSKAAE